MSCAQARGKQTLVNLSNLAWFGSTAADQHLRCRKPEHLETGRPMLRATNTGATAVVRCAMAACRRDWRTSPRAACAPVETPARQTPHLRLGAITYLAGQFAGVGAIWRRLRG